MGKRNDAQKGDVEPSPMFGDERYRGLAFSAGLRDSKAGLDDAKGIPRPRRARLSFNENPFGPAPSALAAIRDEFSRICRYVEEPDDVLTRAIVAREVVSPDQIVLGEILEALGFRMATDGPSGGEFIYSTPGYTALVDAAAPGGGVAVGVPLNQTLQNDLPAIAAKTNARTRAIYLVNPHSPTGTGSDTAMFLDFVREMSKRTTVIVDEAYLEFEPDFAQRTAVELTRAGENVVVFRTFGKLYALAGMAVGYAIAPRAIAASMKRAGIGGPGMLDRLTLAAATASLRDDDYVQSTRAKVTAEREKWHELCDTLKLRHADSRANFVFFERDGRRSTRHSSVYVIQERNSSQQFSDCRARHRVFMRQSYGDARLIVKIRGCLTNIDAICTQRRSDFPKRTAPGGPMGNIPP